jgi:Cu(I)/Ag(I) efflux system membrane protein CusA/SilA
MATGLWLCYLLGYQLSVAAGVGFIALAGLAVETNVVMLVYLQQAWERALQEGTDRAAALAAAAAQRLRPILMTAATIIAGLVPIMLGAGTGSEVMRRIAAPMVGGVVGAVVLTLLVLPPLYYLVRSRREEAQLS